MKNEIKSIEFVTTFSPRTGPLHAWSLKALKIGLSLAAFAVVARSVDLSAAWQHAINQSPVYIAVAAAMLLIQLLLGALRWHIILRALGTTPAISDSFRVFYISAFFNAYLWGAVGGDVLRAWLTYRRKVDAKTAVNSVILDRVAALGAVAILILFSSPFFLVRFGTSLPILSAVGIAAFGLAAIAIASYLDRLPSAWFTPRLVRFLHSLGISVKRVFLSPKDALIVLLFAVTAQLVLGIATYILAVSLNIEVSFLDCVALMQPVVLASNLPISVGGLGVRESAVIILFGLIGVPSSAALVLSLQLSLLALLVVLPGAVLWLFMNVGGRAGKAS